MEDRTKKQKNVSNVIKDGLVSIAGAVEVAMRSPNKKREYAAGGTRTIPGGRAEEREEGPRKATRRNSERRQQRVEASLPTTSKRRSTSASLFSEETGDEINADEDGGRITVPSKLAPSEWRVAKTRNKRTSGGNKEPEEKKNGKKGGPRGERKQPMLRSTLSAVLVKPGVGQSYADVLEKLKSNFNLTETSVEVRGVQKTRDGALLIRLGKGAEDRQGFKTAVIGVLGEIG